MWGLIKVIDRAESEFNGTVQIVSTLEGTRIVAGGVSQSGWLVGKVWNAALKKILKTKPVVKSVLILGLGGGSAARLVNKYWPSAKITGVDIDPIMINFGKKYLDLDKIANLEIVESDAVKFIDNTKVKYDLILMDIYTGAVIPEQFVKKDFLEKVKGILNPEGIAAINHLYTSIESKDAKKLEVELRNIFSGLITVKPEANIIFLCFP
ncbi:MAG: fused MFS/spermidine synthase [bacterium]|nr:fused MFS/spermidine synthase [bacterium]